VPSPIAPRASLHRHYALTRAQPLEHDAAIGFWHFGKVRACQDRRHPSNRLEAASARKLTLAPGLANRLRATANLPGTWIGHLPLCTAQSTNHGFCLSLVLPLARSRRSKDRSPTIRKAQEPPADPPLPCARPQWAAREAQTADPCLFARGRITIYTEAGKGRIAENLREKFHSLFRLNLVSAAAHGSTS
jgi:hypothetical protein